MMLLIAATIVATAAFSTATPAPAPPVASLNACATANPALTTDDLGGIPAPCAAARGTLAIETLYYQNASRVGGTALAAYPLFRLRTGIVRNLEAVVDTPSQIAMSGPNGIGLYPTTRLGYGLSYTFESTARTAIAFGAEMLPPNSRYTVDQAQPQYVLGLSAGIVLGKRWTLSAMLNGTSSPSVGLNRVNPAAAVRVAYSAGDDTQITAGFAKRVVVRRSAAQSSFDLAVNRRLCKNLTFDVGLGTTLNPVSNAKAHYLASGFNFLVK